MIRAGIALMAIVVAAAACGGDDGAQPSGDRPLIADPGAVHVHGLGINPSDGALLLATHTGLFRVAPGEEQARRVGDRFQDTMGFTVVGPDRFLGSGHPDGRDRLPPFLGLIETVDAGGSWEPVSLMAERDFHVLEAAGERVYGFGTDFETREEGLLVSADGGASWDERTVPEPLMSLAIHPKDPQRVLATGEQGMYVSGDAGRSWRSVGGQVGLVAWRSPRAVFLVRLDGQVSRSADAGVTWKPVGDVGGPPSALESAGDELYVALHDGTVKRSTDAGRSWVVRSRP